MRFGNVKTLLLGLAAVTMVAGAASPTVTYAKAKDGGKGPGKFSPWYGPCNWYQWGVAVNFAPLLALCADSEVRNGEDEPKKPKPEPKPKPKPKTLEDYSF